MLINIFTTIWSRACWIAVDDGWRIYHDENEKVEDYELLILLGRPATKQKISRRFELWRDLNNRIRNPWDKNATYQIIFQ